MESEHAFETWNQANEHLLTALACQEQAQLQFALALADWTDSGAWAIDSTTPTRWLKYHHDCLDPTAVKLTGLGRFLCRHPRTRAAVEAGNLTFTQLEWLARVETKKNAHLYERDEGILLGAARLSDTAQFAKAVSHWRSCADDVVADAPRAADIDESSVWWSTGLFGRLEGGFSLDAEAGTIVAAALEALSPPDPADRPDGQRTLGERRAAALVDLADFYLRNSDTFKGDGRNPLALNTLIDLQTLLEEELRQADQHAPRNNNNSNSNSDAVDSDPESSHPETSPPKACGDEPGQHPDPDTTAQNSCARCSNLPLPTPDSISPENPASLVDDLDAQVRRFLGETRTAGGIGSIPASAFVRLGCAAPITRVVMNGPSEIIDVGRAVYRFNHHQRKAIAIRDGGCIFPTCRRPVHWCDAHHVTYWEHGGPTDVANGVMLCRTHHRLIHTGGWNLTANTDQPGYALTAPDGRQWAAANAEERGTQLNPPRADPEAPSPPPPGGAAGEPSNSPPGDPPAAHPAPPDSQAPPRNTPDGEPNAPPEDRPDDETGPRAA